MKIPFSPPFINDAVIDEVVSSLQSGWITSGPKVKALETEISKVGGVSHTVCVNSWTSGAILALKWFGIGAGDEVIVPAYTYSATALAVIHAGATPVMVDVQDDFTIDPSAVAKAITAKTKAIIAVDFAGLMCDYDALWQVIQQPGTLALFQPEGPVQTQLGRPLFISDAAHSIGAFYQGKPSGCCADLTIFSLHAVKNVTTAEGGAICINLPVPFEQEEVYRQMKLWSLNGQNKDAFTKSQAGGWRYDILFPGLKVNMPDICAAVGLAQIQQYMGGMLPERERVAHQYHDFFSGKEWAITPILADEKRKSCFHLYALRVNGITEAQRDSMIDTITEAGIAVNVHFIPMPMLTAFKQLGYRIEQYPQAYNLYANEISLPIYPQLTQEQIDFVCTTVEAAYQKLAI